MTANIAKFFRHTPAISLEKYFLKFPSPVSEAVDWSDLPLNVSKPLIMAVDDLTEDDLAMLNTNSERINEMTDEIGQDALMAVLCGKSIGSEITLSGMISLADIPPVMRPADERSQNFSDIRFIDYARRDEFAAARANRKQSRYVYPIQECRFFHRCRRGVDGDTVDPLVEPDCRVYGRRAGVPATRPDIVCGIFQTNRITVPAYR